MNNVKLNMMKRFPQLFKLDILDIIYKHEEVLKKEKTNIQQHHHKQNLKKL